MNQSPPPKTGPQAAAKPSMSDALEDIFAVGHRRGFADKLTGFAQVLTNAHWSCCLIAEPEAEPVVLAGTLPENQANAVMTPATELLSEAGATGARTVSKSPVLLSRVALPDGSFAVLVLGVPPGSNVQTALNYERAVFLSTLTFARNRPLDRTRQDRLVAQIQTIAADRSTDLTALVNLLSAQTGASYAAAAYWTQGAVEALQISGQDKAAKRAILPDTLRREMRDTASQRLMNAERGFAAAPDQADGLILHVENPTRNLGAVPSLSAVYAMFQKKHKRRRITPARLVKTGAGLLVLIGIGMIPLPDGVELPALVEAETQRVVTAPVTAILEEVFVRDGDSVPAAGAGLVALDSTEIQAELIGIRAEQAKALLEREAARAERNPAALRNAELEVERLESRIALQEFRLKNTRVVAPISGLVVAPDLKERQGTTVRQGEDLLTIADPSKLRLKLSVPETQIGRLQEGATGIFRPDYDPTLRVESAITLISSAKTGEGEEQMFLGRARFDGPEDGLRPGLNGVLSVQRDPKPLGLIVYEAIRNYVLLRLWL